jgi:transcriptional antiterminator NusG
MDWRERLRQLVGHEDIDETQQWHAVFVMTGDEDSVRQRIAYAMREKAIEVVVPKRMIHERRNGQWHERIRPLFPGYILLKGHIDTELYYILKSIPGIVRILKDNQGLYKIQPEEIEVISRLMCNGELIGTSYAFQDGDSIIIKEGPLYGLEGLITAIDRRKGRAKVKLSILGDERTVDLSIKLITTKQQEA